MGPDEDEDDEDGKMEIEQMKEEFDREVHIQMVVCAAGLAPHIWQIIETDEGAGIIMDAMDETLMDRILRDRRHVDDHIVAAKELLLKLHSLGIYHGDAHPRNFMYKGDKLFLVDFGEARFIKPNTLKYAKNDITRLTEDLDRML
jgi:tRNA A-37 threonylcarbamoyl transferase component Bud32